MSKKDLTLGEVKALVEYNYDNGHFFRKNSKGKKYKIGDSADILRKDGYYHIRVKGVRFLSHRLAWFYHYGYWPREFIDHVNGLRGDNRIVNLRETNRSGNGANRPICKSNKCGLKGAYPSSTGNRFYASLKKNKKTIYLGLFKTAQEAHEAYCDAAKEFHGEFANNGEDNE